MAEYWPIKSDNWRLNTAICSLLLICIRNLASLRRSERQFAYIKIKLQAWQSITTDQFILCIVFCAEIRQIDAPILTYDRMYFWQQTIWMISLLWQRLLATASDYDVHSQRMLGNLAQHCKSRSLLANQIGIK